MKDHARRLGGIEGRECVPEMPAPTTMTEQREKGSMGDGVDVWVYSFEEGCLGVFIDGGHVSLSDSDVCSSSSGKGRARLFVLTSSVNKFI